MVVAGVAAEVMLWALGKFAGITLPSNQLIPALLFYMVAGFLGGLYWASRGQARPASSGAGRSCSMGGPRSARLPSFVSRRGGCRRRRCR